jgi:TIR domain
MNFYSAEPPASRPPGPLAGLSPDIRSNPREALRDMRLAGRAREIVLGRVNGSASLEDDRIADPYDDSPTVAERTYSVLRRRGGDVVVLQIPDWVANNGACVGALDETRYAFRGKVVRVVSENVDAPSMGLKRLLRNWQAQEQIDTAFVEWRYVQELGSGRHQLDDVLQFPVMAAAAPASPPSQSAPAAPKVEPPAVFVSYAHLDKDWHFKLIQMLAPLRRRYPQAIWHDVLLQPGVDWSKAIDASLESARIVVLLVTPAFLDSQFIQTRELAPVLKAVEAGEKLLLWVYVSTCAVEDAGIKKYQAAHDINEPLDALSPADQSKQLKKVYDNLSAALAKQPSAV